MAAAHRRLDTDSLTAWMWINLFMAVSVTTDRRGQTTSLN